MTHESLRRTFPNHPTNTEYVPGGYHWSRIGSRFFKKGRHTVEIQIRDKRKQDDQYVLYLDALFLAPKGWQPIRSMGYLPRGLFVES